MATTPRGIRSPIPAGTLIGRGRGKGKGAAQTVSFDEIAQQLHATGAIAPPGSASPLQPIATHTILANPTGSTAAPIATTTPASSSITWAYGATTLTASISATYAGQTSITTLGTVVTGSIASGFGSILTLNGVTGSQLTSTVAIGTAPLVVTSTTLVPNLYVARAALADSATVNANLTGPITSSGNATSIASQTGTGTKFVVDTAPTLVTPMLTGYAVASLPAGTIGMLAYVTDQLTTPAAKGVAPTAGGSVKCLVFFDGSAWVGA